MLKKDLGLLGVFCVSSGAMISSGLFVLPSLAFVKAGPGVLVSYMLAAILVLPAMLSVSELATAMPKAGGAYFYIDRTFGPAFGSMAGIANWFSIGLKSAFALVGIGTFATLIYPDVDIWTIKLISIACCVIFALINIKGVFHAATMQIVMVLGIIAVLILYVIAGIPHIDVSRFTPLAPEGAISIIATAGFVFISYGGLTKIASVAEEVRDPGRNIPLGMALSLSVVTVLYAAVIFITISVLDKETLVTTMTPLSTGAGITLGQMGIVILSVAAMLAFITTANAGILAASRAPLAMSRDGLMPASFAKVSKRFQTPHFAILFTASFMIVTIALLNLENLVKLASTLMILLFIFVNLSVIIMREARIPNYKPRFKSPLYPWVQIAGVVSSFFLIVEMGVVPLFIVMLFLTGSFVWYWVYARNTVARESALIRFIKRIASRALTYEDMGVELKEILRQRDEIVEDRFDRLVGRCLIIDIPEQITAEECFEKMSYPLSDILHLEPHIIEGMLMTRERESSTTLTPGLAVPHILIEGKGIFELVLVRGRKGVIFPDNPNPIHALFALFGSPDERNFHLRALMAIAQIAQSKNFLKRWLDAKGAEELRDVVLLGKRHRHE